MLCLFGVTYNYLPYASMELREFNGRVIITDISIGTPCAKIPRWKSRLRNVCLLIWFMTLPSPRLPRLSLL